MLRLWIDIDNFKQQVECVYKDERYSIRDNGAVFRHSRDGKRPRQYDNFWTFGKANDKHGYMEIASVRVHIIVATAFHGPKPTKEHVVDHIDTNRRNNRPDNLRWVTRLENALDNPITRKRIIMRCGSIEAFLVNPSLLREGDVTPDFSWMRTVTNAEAQVSKERLLAWAESDRQASGGALGEWVYGRQPISQNGGQLSNVDKIDEVQSDSLNGWGQIPPLANDHFIEPEQSEPNIMPSLTPGAAQEIYFYNDKPNEYPCTPQKYSGDPLTVYAANLTENTVFWRNNNGEREYVVVKYGFSEDRQSLYVMSKSAYVWRNQDDGEAIAVPIANLNKDEFSEDELNYQLGEVVYENNLFVHKRVETGFMPKEYLEELFDECIGKKNKKIDKN